MSEKSVRHDAGETPDILGYLARAWDALWALRLASVVLFADVWLVWRTGQGMIGWRVPALDTWLQVAGEIVAAGLAFCLLMSLLVPSATFVLGKLTIAFGASEPGLAPDTHNGYVSAEELRDYAHRTSDTMALQIVDAHVAHAKTQKQHAEQLAQLILGLIALGVADLLFGLHNDMRSLIGAAISFSTFTKVSVALLGLGGARLLYAICQTSFDPTAVLYRPAAEAFAKKQKDIYEPFVSRPPPSATYVSGLGGPTAASRPHVPRDASPN